MRRDINVMIGAFLKPVPLGIRNRIDLKVGIAETQ
jgi:hypothetical protein